MLKSAGRLRPDPHQHPKNRGEKGSGLKDIRTRIIHISDCASRIAGSRHLPQIVPDDQTVDNAMSFLNSGRGSGFICPVLDANRLTQSSPQWIHVGVRLQWPP